MTSNDETDYEALATRLTSPDVDVRAAEPPLHGDDAAAEGRAFLLREYGTDAAIRSALRGGRPRVGDEGGVSPTVRGRISRHDFAAVKLIEANTGKTQSQLVREGIQLVLERYHLTS